MGPVRNSRPSTAHNRNATSRDLIRDGTDLKSVTRLRGSYQNVAGRDPGKTFGVDQYSQLRAAWRGNILISTHFPRARTSERFVLCFNGELLHSRESRS